jgi:hypothetical protein
MIPRPTIRLNAAECHPSVNRYTSEAFHRMVPAANARKAPPQNSMTRRIVVSFPVAQRQDGLALPASGQVQRPGLHRDRNASGVRRSPANRSYLGRPPRRMRPATVMLTSPAPSANGMARLRSPEALTTSRFSEAFTAGIRSAQWKPKPIRQKIIPVTAATAADFGARAFLPKVAIPTARNAVPRALA